MNPPLTIVILHHQDLLAQTLKSALFADEIIIIHDQKSVYPPPDLKNKKIKLFSRPLDSFANQRNFALKKARNNWLFFLDADEIISPALAREICSSINASHYSGFFVRRYDFFYGQKLVYGEIKNINLLRLAKKKTGLWQRQVHETWHIKGRVGDLKHPLIHRRKNLTTSFLDRFVLYSPLDAQGLDKENKPFSYFRLFFYPLAKFFKNYFVNFGFLDGTLGLFHAYLISLQSLTVRIYQHSS